SNLVLKAISTKTGYYTSGIYSGTYVIPGTLSELFTLSAGANGKYTGTYGTASGFTNPMTITKYSLSPYDNNIIFDANIIYTQGQAQDLNLGIINTSPTIKLYLSDGNIITKATTNVNTDPATGDCPTGYVPVPGNVIYGTESGTYASKKGFCVAKYEMKLATGSVITTPACTTGSENYSAQTATVASTATGSPLVAINQCAAKQACVASGGHLITNNEWMTLARNIEMVTSNWSGGVVGDGNIYSGHNDSVPNAAQAGDTNNSNGYYLTGQSSGNQRRTLTLTNGQVVWDMSGNVWEWTNNTILRKDEPDGYLNSTDAAYTGGWNWEDYNKASGGTYYLKSSNLGSTTLKYNDLFLLSSSSYTAATNGIGRIYTYSNSADADTTVYGFLRGGAWYHGADAGLLALGLDCVPGCAGTNIGFRCVVVP
ncbi:MAG: SUMF1/EgtB/PvdO family nonheme iron enzyme, partial [archaeon]